MMNDFLKDDRNIVVILFIIIAVGALACFGRFSTKVASNNVNYSSTQLSVTDDNHYMVTAEILGGSYGRNQRVSGYITKYEYNMWRDGYIGTVFIQNLDDATMGRLYNINAIVSIEIME